MPELPEVETIKRDLIPRLKNLSIVHTKIFDNRVIKDLNQKTFESRVTGCTISDLKRQGKALIFYFDSNQFMVVQLKMTGQLIYSKAFDSAARSRDTKVVFTLSNGDFLLYNDQRTFGWLILTESLQKISFLSTLGVEPLEKTFTATRLKAKFLNRKAPVKSALLNQHLVAGIGNIYASEILFDAGISPVRQAGQMNQEEIVLLVKMTKKVLNKAIRLRGSSMRNYRDAEGNEGLFKKHIKVYARENQPCVKCGELIVRIVQSGRSTFYCEHCQK